MKKPQEIVLGNIVRDAVTGYTGTATGKVEMMGGNVQFAVQPKMKGDDPAEEYPTGMNLDFHTLDVIEEGIAARTTKAIPITVQLGDEVEDTVTGIKGVATARHTFINGCIYYNVQSKSQADKQSGLTGVTPPEFFNQARLKVIKPLAVYVPPAPPTDTSLRRPGGPATKAMRPS